MKVSTEIDNNFGYEKITQLVDYDAEYSRNWSLMSGYYNYIYGLLRFAHPNIKYFWTNLINKQLRLEWDDMHTNQF